MIGRRVTFSDDDRAGHELRALASKRATTAALAQSDTLLDHPLIDKLADPANRTERARILSQLLQCSLLLAYTEWQADRGNLLAGDALAAGALFGMLSQTPSDPLPITLPLRINNWTNERRQQQSLLWAGSHVAGTSRSARAWRDTYLDNWREFFQLITASGELERCFRDHFACSLKPAGPSQCAPTERYEESKADPQRPDSDDRRATVTQGFHGLYQRALARLHQFQEKP